MAYLNVRERRIEAKIAYVGSESSGKATNFDQLKRATPDSRIGKVESSKTETEDVLSVAWRPANGGGFRDCDILVRLVAQHGAVTDERFTDAMRDVDGVVVILDATPAAQVDNRASLAAVREVLARSERRDVPVVLQVNGTDLPDAMLAADVVQALDATTLRHVVASAVNGQGVVETLEAALNEVLAAMQTERTTTGEQKHDSSWAGEARDVGASTAVSKAPDGGHPLLAALRQILRETVREHVEELEQRMTRRVSQSLANIELRLASAETAAADRHQKTEARLLQLAKTLEEMPAKKDVAAWTKRVDRLREETKADLSAAIALRAEAERVHLDGALAAIRATLETANSTTSNEDLEETIGTMAEAMTTLVPRLEEVEMAMKQRAVRVEATVRALRTEFTGAIAATDEKIDTVHTRINELVEELKKPKKGWFA